MHKLPTLGSGAEPQPAAKNFGAIKLTSGNKETIFLNIYRPPSSKISTFFDEFQNLLEFFVPLPSELIITGDFNIHTDSDLTTPNNGAISVHFVMKSKHLVKQ